MRSPNGSEKFRNLPNIIYTTKPTCSKIKDHSEPVVRDFHRNVPKTEPPSET